MKVRRYVLTASLFLVACGCATFSIKQPIAGYYASNPVPEDSKSWNWADGQRHLVTLEWTLTLFPDGTYVAGWRRYLDGEFIRESVLAAYELRGNSRGSWTLANRQLLLRSVGARDTLLIGKNMRDNGRLITPENSEAHVTLKEGHWIIDWNQIEYRYIAPAPNQSPDPTPTSVTPAGGQQPHQQ
jgi:hypothetical protein